MGKHTYGHDRTARQLARRKMLNTRKDRIATHKATIAVLEASIVRHEAAGEFGAVKNLRTSVRRLKRQIIMLGEI